MVCGLAVLSAAKAAEPATQPPTALFREGFEDSRLLQRGWYDGGRFTISGQESVNTLSGTVNIPIFTTRSISDIVSVRDGEAFCMGGLLARSEIERVSKIPLLGDIPIIGFLFKSKSRELRETQVIFYIEPHIVMPGEGLFTPGTG